MPELIFRRRRTQLLRRLGTRGSSDQGAVAPLVAVLLASGLLLGMAAWVVDGGLLYAERDQVLNAAGAAALAAAEQCVRLVPADCGKDTALVGAADANAKDGAMSIDRLCGHDRGGFNGLDPCPPSGDGGGAATRCLAPPPARTSYAEVYAGTLTADNRTLLPRVFSLGPGSHVQACARVAWGPPHGPYAGIGMSLCAFKVLTDGPGTTRVITAAPPFRPSPAVERPIALQGPTPTGCDDLVYYVDPDARPCTTPAAFGEQVNGWTDNQTNTVVPAPACIDLIRSKEVAKVDDPQPYLLMPLYNDGFTADPATGRATFTIAGIAAFRVTGDKLTDEPSPGDVLDRGVTEDNFCGPGTTRASRCIRGYFVWANIIDGTPPAEGWTGTYGVAAYKTVG